MLRSAIFLGPVTALALAACMVAIQAPDVGFEVSAHRTCGPGCHQLDVRLENNEKRNLENRQPLWVAVGSDGVERHPDSFTGPPLLAPGGVAEYRLTFTVPAGVTLETLRYRASWMDEAVQLHVGPPVG